VENDFAVIWPQLVPGGAVGFHDYHFADWPEVTPAVDGIVSEHRGHIAETVVIKGKGDVSTLLLVKR
jgi:hypothetical protein